MTEATAPWKFKTGTTTEWNSTVDVSRTLGIDSTKWTAIVNDGDTPGGHPLARETNQSGSFMAKVNGASVETPVTFTNGVCTGGLTI